jgi:hypothetical protein
MTDPVALLSEYLRIDTSKPRGDCRGAAELFCGALREDGPDGGDAAARQSRKDPLGGRADPCRPGSGR